MTDKQRAPVAHIKLIADDKEARTELQKIGIDSESESIMAPKLRHLVVKLKAIDVRAANILKQEMLAKGAEAAVAKWASGFTKPTTDVLLMGTVKQYRLVLKKLRVQPFGLKNLVEPLTRILNQADNPAEPIIAGGRQLVGGQRTLLMGILNVTPDSFSDGGLYVDIDAAVGRAKDMISAGADIIDIGGESSRPGAEPVGEEEELGRVIPVIERLAAEVEATISVDTSKSRVAEAAIQAGATIVNDITALRGDPDMAEVCATGGAGVILMHMLGEPRTMQADPQYQDLLSDLAGFFTERIAWAQAAGIDSASLMIDPGFGFGKTVAHNLELLKRLSELKSLGRPIVLGTSRKATIGAVLGGLGVDDRLEGTAATVTAGIMAGVRVVRVHDVSSMRRVVMMTDAIVAGEAWNG